MENTYLMPFIERMNRFEKQQDISDEIYHKRRKELQIDVKVRKYLLPLYSSTSKN